MNIKKIINFNKLKRDDKRWKELKEYFEKNNTISYNNFRMLFMHNIHDKFRQSE